MAARGTVGVAETDAVQRCVPARRRLPRRGVLLRQQVDHVGAPQTPVQHRRQAWPPPGREPAEGRQRGAHLEAVVGHGVVRARRGRGGRRRSSRPVRRTRQVVQARRGRARRPCSAGRPAGRARGPRSRAGSRPVTRSRWRPDTPSSAWLPPSAAASAAITSLRAARSAGPNEPAPSPEPAAAAGELALRRRQQDHGSRRHRRIIVDRTPARAALRCGRRIPGHGRLGDDQRARHRGRHAGAGGGDVRGGAVGQPVGPGRPSGRCMASIRPVLVPSRLDDAPEKVGFIDGHWMRVEGGGGVVEVDRRRHLPRAPAPQRRQRARRAGSLATSKSALNWERCTGRTSRTFRRLTRDLYVPAGDHGFWQGTLRDPASSLFRRRRRRDRRPAAAHARSPLRRPRGRPADDHPVRAHAAPMTMSGWRRRAVTGTSIRDDVR